MTLSSQLNSWNDDRLKKCSSTVKSKSSPSRGVIKFRNRLKCPVPKRHLWPGSASARPCQINDNNCRRIQFVVCERSALYMLIRSMLRGPTTLSLSRNDTSSMRARTHTRLSRSGANLVSLTSTAARSLWFPRCTFRRRTASPLWLNFADRKPRPN